MAVLYHSSCMAPSLVKIGKPRRTPPGRWDVSPGPGGTKKAGVWPGPGPRSDYDCVSIKAAVASFRFITAIYKFPVTNDSIVDVELFLLLGLVID